MCRGIPRAKLEGQQPIITDFNPFKNSGDQSVPNFDLLDSCFDSSWGDFSFPSLAVEKAAPKKEVRVTSYDIFVSYYDADKRDASGVVGLECYNEWIASRSKEYKKPCEGFRKAITAHITKTCGRQSFPEDIEIDLLRVIREKKPWPVAAKLGITLGSNGFRTKGYHESVREACNKRKIEVDDVPSKKTCYSDSCSTDEGSVVSTPTPQEEDVFLESMLENFSEDGSNIKMDERIFDDFLQTCFDEFGGFDEVKGDWTS